MVRLFARQKFPAGAKLMNKDDMSYMFISANPLFPKYIIYLWNTILIDIMNASCILINIALLALYYKKIQKSTK